MMSIGTKCLLMRVAACECLYLAAIESLYYYNIKKGKRRK